MLDRENSNYGRILSQIKTRGEKEKGYYNLPADALPNNYSISFRELLIQ